MCALQTALLLVYRKSQCQFFNSLRSKATNVPSSKAIFTHVPIRTYLPSLPFHRLLQNSSNFIWVRRLYIKPHTRHKYYSGRKDFSSGPQKLPVKEFRRLLGIAKPERWRLTGAVILLILSSSVTIAFPFCLGKIIDIIFSSPSEEMKDSLTSLCKILILVFIIGGLANFGRVYLMNLSAQRIVNRLRMITYNSILKQEISFFDKSKTGELINRLSTDTSVVGLSITMNISDGLRSSFAMLAGISLMVYTSPQLSLVGLAVVPPVAITAVIYGRILKKITAELQDSLAHATEVAEEHISNIRTVRAFAQETKESNLYEERIENILKLARKESLARAVFFGSTGFSGNLVVLAVMYYGGLMMTDSAITVGNLSSFLMYAAYVGISIGGLSSFYAEMMRGLGASTRLWKLIDRQPVIPLSGGIVLPSLKGEVNFSDITFAYPSRSDVPVLQNLSLNIPSGTVHAVVGTSGSGKSTLGALLLRFYDPQTGTVTVDGTDVKKMDLEWLRSNVGIVPQEPVLFSCSIQDNILYGSLTPSSIKNNTIISVAQEANAWEFIKKLPDGLHTLVGEKGVLLSGGQRQRIAIARAFLKNPKILILDEATSALDAESEELVQDAMERLMKGRTVIIIAHRLSTVRNADKIAVLHRGQVVELGTYDELMAERGMFYRLMERQTTY